MINKKLNFISAVMRLRSAFHAVNTVVALYGVSKDEWLRCVNPDDDTHYIKDYQVDGRKADAVINYVTRIAAVYMSATGVLPGTLSKDTLSSENDITVSIMRRLAGVQIKNNEDLFLLVATRLLGIDASLVKAGMTTDEVRYSLLVEHLVVALGEEYVKSVMQPLTDFIVKAGTSDRLNDELFCKLLAEGDKYYDEEPESIADAIDVIDLVADRINGQENAESQ